MYPDDDTFPVKCPHCDHEFLEKIASIKTGTTICQAPDCRCRITHPAEQFALILSDKGGDARRDYLRRFLRLTKLQ
jgi:hypothetical protein